MKILLHICCAPCAVYSIKKLREKGNLVEGLFYNPNIHPAAEYMRRREAAARLSEQSYLKIHFFKDLQFEDFFRKVVRTPAPNQYRFGAVRDSAPRNPEAKGATGVLRQAIRTISPWGSTFPDKETRCALCWSQRLAQTAEYAAKNGFDGFCTTLLISPYQDHEKIKEIARGMMERYSVPFIFEDFRPGFKESHRGSKEMGLYHQNYCGCIYSERERHAQTRDSS